MRTSNFTKTVWTPAKTNAGVDTNLRIHDLRHTCAALMIAAGAHPEKIKRHMGHSSITVTMDLYGHLLPSEDEALADRLDQQYRQAVADNRRTRTV